MSFGNRKQYMTSIFSQYSVYAIHNLEKKQYQFVHVRYHGQVFERDYKVTVSGEMQRGNILLIIIWTLPLEKPPKGDCMLC